MADLTYRLVLRATFEGREQLEQAVQELDKIQFQGAKVGVSVQQGAKEAGVGLQGIARSAMSVGFMFNMVESAWMRQTMASIMASNAQDRYNDAVARYGVTSREAQRAARQLTQEMQYLDAANMRANVSMGLMAGTMLISTGLLQKETWATVASTASKTAHTIATKLNSIATGENILTKIAHKAVTIACTAVEWLENAALQAQLVLKAALSYGVAVPLMIAGAAAVAGIAGYYMGGRQQGGFIEKEGLYHLHTGEKVLSKESVLASMKESNSKETFKSLQTGGLVEKEGVYHLHTGERVLSKESVSLYEKMFTTNNIEKTAFTSMQKGGTIEKEGLYHLHTGEKVLSKESVLSSNSKETFKSLQTGGLVEKEGVYHLHTGEQVLSKESVSLYEKMFATNNIEKSTFMGTRHDGGYVPQTGVYGLLAGEHVSKNIQTTTLETSKAEVFNIQSDIHVETDLERALQIQNRKIVNEWKRMRP